MNKIPEHLAIIIDGNRRWAKEKNLPSFFGHKKGFDKVEEIGEYAFEKGIKTLTIFAFSTENWNREKKEVNYLMKLLYQALKNIKKYNKKGIKIKVVGQIKRLPKKLQEIIKKAETQTKKNEKILNLAISYGSKTEIISAIKKASKLTEKEIEKNLWVKSSPDLVIRTGGEYRLSNFLLWQIAYSELYFIKKYWPDFTKKDLDQALIEYSSRSRRFGK
ncbi:MAG: polyprenyl diphosphate synthase [Candidatus Pacebacteria bacterium]|nr:polyprenyl diphosphate synthase [Candidatus Paceibacterota bacterium]